MIRLVIVDDDEDERFFMREAFEASGHFSLIGEYGNGDQLLDWLDGGPPILPELVITDLNMPGKNGYDILSRVTNQYPHIAVIATSTSSIAETRNKCRTLGALDFMAKPDVFINYDHYVDQVYELMTQEQGKHAGE